jgi:hypothetical protein
VQFSPDPTPFIEREEENMDINWPALCSMGFWMLQIFINILFFLGYNHLDFQITERLEKRLSRLERKG